MDAAILTEINAKIEELNRDITAAITNAQAPLYMTDERVELSKYTLLFAEQRLEILNNDYARLTGNFPEATRREERIYQLQRQMEEFYTEHPGTEWTRYTGGSRKQRTRKQRKQRKQRKTRR